MNEKSFLTTLDKRATQDTKNAKDVHSQQVTARNFQALIDSIAVATKALIAFQSNHQPKVSVTNQPKFPNSISTPDVQLVVKALENLKQPLQDNKPDDTKIVEAVNQLNDSISKLPTAYPEMPEPLKEVTVKNQPNYTKQFASLGEAIKSIDVKPIVKIPEEQPDDYTPITNSLSIVVKAIKAIKVPQVPVTDLTPLVIATNQVQESINSLRFPTANYILPFTDTNGKATQAPVPLVDKPFDYVGFSNPDVNDNYQTITFNSGGVSGSPQRTLTLTYDSSNNITSIART